MTTRVALVGASGKLGTIIRRVIDGLDGIEVTHALGSRDTFASFSEVDLVVDATHPVVSADVVSEAIAARVNVLVATSGWSADRIAALRPAVAEAGIGVVFIPNFSLGSIVATALAAAAGRLFDSVEIIEAHRDTKVDSPSGTAVRTAEMIAASRGIPVAAPHVDQRARGQQVASIPVHSLRRPGVIARQDVILSGQGESVTITHDTIDSAAAYAPGIAIAVRSALDISGIVVGLENFIDIGIGAPAGDRS